MNIQDWFPLGLTGLISLPSKGLKNPPTDLLLIWGDNWMSWLDGITALMDMNLSKLQDIVKDREAWCAVTHGITKSQTQLSDWTTTINI